MAKISTSSPLAAAIFWRSSISSTVAIRSRSPAASSKRVSALAAAIRARISRARSVWRPSRNRRVLQRHVPLGPQGAHHEQGKQVLVAVEPHRVVLTEEALDRGDDEAGFFPVPQRSE